MTDPKPVIRNGWYGHLAASTAELIAEHIRHRFIGPRERFCTVNVHAKFDNKPAVRTGQRMRRDVKVQIQELRPDGPCLVHLEFEDSDTILRFESEARTDPGTRGGEEERPYFIFTHDQCQIESTDSFGERVFTVLTREYTDDLVLDPS